MEVAKILMDRDGITKEEAKQRIKSCQAEMQETIAYGDIHEVENILMDHLGLEPDYLFEVLGEL